MNNFNIFKICSGNLSKISPSSHVKTCTRYYFKLPWKLVTAFTKRIGKFYTFTRTDFTFKEKVSLTLYRLFLPLDIRKLNKLISKKLKPSLYLSLFYFSLATIFKLLQNLLLSITLDNFSSSYFQLLGLLCQIFGSTL